MNIRYGFDIALELPQPTTILATMDVHSDFRHCIAKETELELSPAIAAERFVDGHGNIVKRLSAPAGPVSMRLEGVFRSEGREDEIDVAAKRSQRRNCRAARCRSFGRADIARPTFSPISRGRTSAPSAAGGPACRPSAISFINA